MAGHEPGVLQETAQDGDSAGRQGRPGTLPVAVQTLRTNSPERAGSEFRPLATAPATRPRVVGSGLAEQLRVILLQVPAQVPQGRHGVDITDVELKFSLVGLNLRLTATDPPGRRARGIWPTTLSQTRATKAPLLSPKARRVEGIPGLSWVPGLAHQEILLHRAAFLK